MYGINFSEVLQCKTRKKKKINFNEFIWFYWRHEFFFFGGLTVVGTKEK